VLSRLLRNQRFVVAVVYICGMLMNTLDSTIVNVALATLARDFDVDPSQIQSVVIGYLVSLAVFIPISGWLGDRFGTKRVFLFALFVFTGASMLCGMAQGLDQLVLFRILQGVGGGLLTPVGMAMLYRTFPPEERVGVSRILMIATIFGPALGPIIGGVLIEHLSWRWTFYVNVPVGTVALIVGMVFLDEHREEAAGRFDLAGFVLAGAGFAGFMFALSEGPGRGWTSPEIAATGLLGLALLVAFVVVELRTREPMIQLGLLGNRLFRSMLTTSFFASGGFLGVLFLTPLFLQEAFGYTPLESGLATFPEAIGVLISSQVVARIYPAIGPRRLMITGMIIVTFAALAMVTVTESTNVWAIRFYLFMVGVGMANLFIPNQAAMLATISRAQTGRATTLTSVQRQVGSSLGIAVLASILAFVGPTEEVNGVTVPNLDGYHLAFVAAAAFAIIAAVLATRVPDADAANTMVRRRSRTVDHAETRAPSTVP
jgi:EmrB/QacA subfamily drug resistance transporter